MINFVVIDLGSNSVRMRINELMENGSFLLTHQVKEYVRLSENMGPDKVLQKEPMERTIKALQEFKKIYDQLPNPQVHAIATAAVRQAKNQKHFLKRVKEAVDLEFDVISGDQEAYLDYLGVTRTLPVNDCIIMDTGGASTELVYVEGGKMRDRISIPLGSVLISQRFGLDDEISAVSLFKAMTFVEQSLAKIDWLQEVHGKQLIGLGGSNRTLAKIMRRQLALDPDDLPDIHGMHVPSAHVYELMESVIQMNRTQREKTPGLAKVRADVIVGGWMPIILVMRMLDIQEVVFSNHGLREGVLYDYLDHQA